MDPDLARVLDHTAGDHGDRARRVGSLADKTRLWALMSAYDWDDGYAVPLAVVRHPRCDRGLALRLFWELDDAARTHVHDEENGLRSCYSVELRHRPDEFARIVAYCTALVDGLRAGTFPVGRNSFDTGFFDADDPSLTDRQKRLRSARTRVAQRDYDDSLLRPVTGTG